MIEIRHLRKEYENATPLKDVNTVINEGDVISIIGPSGTGKSTLMRCINLLETPTSGDIIIDGKNVTKGEMTPEDVRKKIGMVFQSFNLYPHLSVIENVMVPQMEVLGRSKQEAFDKAAGLLKSVGLYDRMYNFPDMLSGGQKQRIAIARTLAMDTQMVLFDEPTSALDPTMVDEVQYVIKQLAKTGKTIMIVTHEMRFAREIANRVFFMCDGEIYEDGTPEQIFEHPQREKTQEFINRISKKEILIESDIYDLPGVMRDINMYGEKNRLSFEKVSRMQHIFEEMVSQILIPRMGKAVKIKIELSHSEVTGVTGMAFHHTLDVSDMLANPTEEEKYAADIINRMAKEVKTDDSYAEGYLRRVKIVL